jgi:sortase A
VVALGVLLVLAGVGTLGWVGWQLWGTTYVAHARQHDLVDQVERQWARGGDSVRASEGTVGALVRIPRFGRDFEVPLVDGFDDDALAAGLARLPDGAEPGAEGNLVVAGHRITHGEPLRSMPELRAGDTVEVSTATTTYVYELDTAGDALEVPFTARWVLAAHPENPDAGGVGPTDDRALLTLLTCAELFHTDERLVAFGHLVEERPR